MDDNTNLSQNSEDLQRTWNPPGELGAVTAAVHADDYAWFAAHPNAPWRLRAARPGEFWPFLPHIFMVGVVVTAPGLAEVIPVFSDETGWSLKN
jgi:hypothetical protein